jgi:hypothetical protein
MEYLLNKSYDFASWAIEHYTKKEISSNLQLRFDQEMFDGEQDNMSDYDGYFDPDALELESSRLYKIDRVKVFSRLFSFIPSSCICFLLLIISSINQLKDQWGYKSNEVFFMSLFSGIFGLRAYSHLRRLDELKFKDEYMIIKRKVFNKYKIFLLSNPLSLVFGLISNFISGSVSNQLLITSIIILFLPLLFLNKYDCYIVLSKFCWGTYQLFSLIDGMIQCCFRMKCFKCCIAKKRNRINRRDMIKNYDQHKSCLPPKQPDNHERNNPNNDSINDGLLNVNVVDEPRSSE